MFKKVGIALLVVVLLGGAAFGAAKYKKLQDENKKLKNPQEQARIQTESLIKEVGAITVLPADETPTVATVADASKLKNQAFFKDAQNGDKVLIYTKAKKAYLYRPSTKKIIQIAPVNIGASQSGTTGTTGTSGTTTTPKK